MATVRSVDFLPEIFQTDANRQFLAATLDQLIQEPQFKKTQGFIGRTVGPGVNPNDRYVVEPTEVRRDYQLEPGVVSLVPDSDRVRDAITYPGINDAIGYNGGNQARPDLLYSSEYYSWDPFVDFDSFVNFSQYYWLPGGPDPVDVAAEGIPTSANYRVTRANGVYTFSDISGDNPVVELVRGGSYTFQVSQNDKETVNYRVKNFGTAAYVIDSQNNPTLTLARGNTYVFTMALNGDYPFWIKTAPTTGRGNAYTQGVTGNGNTLGLVTFTVPQDAPDTLYYIAENQGAMTGVLNIVNSAAGTGPGFWIQATPGVSGVYPATPNISSRDVFGVVNNGEDVGTITFNVPRKTAQSFYYNLNSIGTVDLVTGLKFDQINNQPVLSFIDQYGGIDGITTLNGRTLIFTNPIVNAEDGGWLRTTLFDPLAQSSANNGLPGSYDSIPYDQTTEIGPTERYQIWQITYANLAGIDYIQLSKIADVSALSKFSIAYGAEYSSTQWYKTESGTFERIPLLTSAQDILYYQDGTDPEIFGQIKLIDQTQSTTIFVDQIIGLKTYTSPNGVKFSNGLKVKFVGEVEPEQYRSGTDAISYTATAAGTNYITSDDAANLYVGEEIIFAAPALGGLEVGKSYYVRSISADTMKFTVSAEPGGDTVVLSNATGADNTATAIRDRQYYVAGVGTAIELLPVDNFIVPESYATDADTDTISVDPAAVDYLTISRASRDLNPWTRSNRWFHLDIINATAAYNNTTAVLDNNYRAKRPIIQFRPGIRLWNMGTEGKVPVDIIDFEETDAFSNINGSTGYTTNGYTFVEGSRVIFAADEDVDVRNKIYVVSFIVPDSVDPLIAQPVINLTLAADGDVYVDQSTVVLYGNDTAGITFWFNGTDWVEAQQKTAVQQAPLYNVYDPEGVSFGNEDKYQSTTFAGSKLFSYAVGDTSVLDPVLQFPLEYLNINNVGDIVFENNLYKDSFLYVVDNSSVTVDISSGSVREYATRTAYNREIGWQTAPVTSQIYQQFKFNYLEQTVKLDVAVLNQTATAVPVIKIYVNSIFVDPTTYTYITTADSTEITLQTEYTINDIVEVLALSDQTSKTAFYQVPINLESNPLNANSPSFTLGTIRTHYQSICENLVNLQGPVNGANNIRDLGNVVPYGLTILQQSAPMTLTGYFMRSDTYNIFNSIRYNGREYVKFKAQLLDAVIRQNIGFNTTAQVLNTALEDITLGKVDSQPFYWSDMLPAGVTTYSTTYTVSFITGNTFDTVQVYNYTSANYLGMLVYKNNQLMTRGVDYTVAVDGPRIIFDTALAVGDVVRIDEYSATYGSFVPNTPTKLGLYPAFLPALTVQQTSSGDVITVIRGHDGSTTPTFGDIRDQVLLEFETRIYNNLKLDGNPVPLTVADVIPGQFRSTGYAFSEINSILSEDFLSYCGWNKLDYQAQQFSATNEFSWNYSSSQNKLNNQNLLGAWRGINRYFYDTQQPSYAPWEMLGLSIKPTWWDDYYGPAPYTRDNLVLWEDLAAGYVADPIEPYYVAEYARPGLLSVLPTASDGNLLPPLESVVGTFNETQIQKSWAVGDGGPVEASWWNSSAYPFAVMRLLALTRPAKFFSLFADRDRYRYSEEYQQYLYDNRYRLDANGIEVYGNGVSKASYINWIVDYNRLTGADSTADLTADLASLDVRLCYRMASFSDKQYIKLYTEKSSPNSTNTALLIPDESYDILLYKNQPFDRSIYSSITIQRTESGGFAIGGYSTVQPYFNILTSRATGKLQTYTNSGITIRVPTFYTDQITQVPYGFVFSSVTSVADFLLSYGKYLERQGFTFTDTANGYILDWSRMVQEFMYWSQQGWDTDAIINLNPLAGGLTVTKAQSVVDSIKTQTVETNLLDQNSQDLATRNLNIVRLNNTFSVQPLNTQAISYADLSFTAYEHMVVLSNQSVFGDLIYDPTTGARQSRLNLIAVTTADWNGSVNAPGFILNQDNVEEWTGLRTYSKGEIVKYKNVYWSALKIVQPSAAFNFNDWTQSDYEQIETGLLPNLSNKANQLANTYNINLANIETDNDLLSYGLIGFRPRQYMAALNLDDVSQVNVYRQFLGTKGTALAAELFKGATLGKETADYDIYENWAVQRAVYGANANRSFFELRLNRALLNANPSLVQVVQPQETSQADQTVLVGDIWRESYKITSPDILPTTTDLPTDIGLPTAGYVSVDDADITVFDINDTTSLSENIDSIQDGTVIWVAKINDYDWGIYRAQAVPGVLTTVCDNLNGTSRAIFTKQHGLAVGDKLIVKEFDPAVNGVYTVIAVADLTSVVIAFQFTDDRTIATGQGIGFTLQTMRVAQASDIVDLPYANQIQSGARVWVDDNGSGLWQVIEKQDIFDDVTTLSPIEKDADEQYGAAVAQAQNRLVTLVGSPRYNHGSGTLQGAVYLYVKNYDAAYTPVSPLGSSQDAILTLNATGVRGYGNAVDFGDQTWAVAGASASLGPGSEVNNGYACVIYRDPALGQPGVIPYAQWQLLTQPGTTTSTTPGAGEFGYSVAMSLDERWMYIGAPGLNEVHAYGRVDWENQFVRTRGDSITDTYNIGDVIQIDQGTQLRVSVDGLILALGTDYTVSVGFDTVTFTTPPAFGTLIDIQRIYVKQMDAQTYYDVGQSATSGSGIGAQFTIVRVRGEVGQPGGDAGSIGPTSAGTGYAVLDTVTIAATDFGGGVDGVNDAVLTVASVDSSGGITGVNIAYTPPALEDTFDLSENFFTADNIYAFSVTADNVLYRPNIDYTFNDSTKELTFDTVPGSGAVIIINAQGYFEYVDTLTVAGLDAGARFGESVRCSTDGRQIIVGAPDQTVSGNTEAGIVYVFDRNVQKFIRANDSSNAYQVLGTPVAPVSVIVNNTFLVNETDSVDSNTNTFSVAGNTITINQELIAGDVIEIETNQFTLLQTITQNQVEEFSNFGEKVDLCSYNCSLYIGAPQSSLQIYKGGVVERGVNQSKTYGIITSTEENPTLTAGHTLRVNDIDIAVPADNPTVEGLAQAINGYPSGIQTGVPNVLATVDDSGLLTLSVKNTDAAPEGDKLNVAPGSVGTAFTDLGFDTFVWTQNITSPYPTAMAGFGKSISVDTSATNIVVGAPKGTLYLAVIFDDGTTDFDSATTDFFDLVAQGGAVYTFDFLNSVNSSVNNPGKFVFGVQIYNSNVGPYDQFGLAINYTSGILAVGAPGNDAGDSTSNYGAVFVFENESRVSAWQAQIEQQPVVDVRLLNSVFLYDRLTGATTEFLDYINPLQGKILGAARQNIDYIGAVDPAAYNSGITNIRGNTWGVAQVGKVWWDTSTVRFVDPNQDSIVYASRRWSQVFPGSAVDVYQWISSLNPPATYAGEGTVKDTLSFTVNSRLGNDGILITEYYFWVRGITSTSTQTGKTLPISTVANYIESPRASGIPYIAAIDSSTVAIYNSGDLIAAADTILHIEFDQQLTSDNVHVEYELIPQDRADGFLSNNLYRKMQDSFCGIDEAGNLVPDPALNVAERYGIQFRPRQSMFVDRFEALRNYLTRANAVLKQYAIVESRVFNLLNSSEPEPSSVARPVTVSITAGDPAVITWPTDEFSINSQVLFSGNLPTGISANTVYYITRITSRYSFNISTTIGGPFVAVTGTVSGSQSGRVVSWNLKVANLEILGFQNIDAVDLGYKYLVETDSNNRGRWTIYQVATVGAGSEERELMLYRVQNYNTPDYWSYINWYRPGYNSSTKIITEVPTYTALQSVSVPIGSSVKVTANSRGKWEIYLLTDLGWERVGLEDGTIEFSSELWNYLLGRFGFDLEVFDAQYYDQEPVIETRKVIQAINEELFVDDLAIERNRALMLVFNYVLGEFAAPEWLVKTSLIDVDHRIRELVPFQNYIRDNQEFVEDYIQEVKPYHVQIREFNLKYTGEDEFDGDTTDFDLPAFFDTVPEVPQYVSPILLPYTVSTAFNTALTTNSDVAADSTLWTTWPYNQWYENYLLTVKSVTVVAGGTGYNEPPVVTVVGSAVQPAEARAVINSLGQVTDVIITSPGVGYAATPEIVFSGGNGSGAQAYVIMTGAGTGQSYNTDTTGSTVDYNLVRSFRTVIRYDRFQYQSTVSEWSSTATYQNGDLVRYDNRVWEADSSDSTAVVGPTFDLANWAEVDAGTYQYPGAPAATGLTGLDRTQGLYVPGVNSPGLELPLLIDGLEYPGVQVYGDYFSQTSTLLDTVYESEFTDTALGDRYTDINVNGGEFIGPYEGHAPEELVNGSEFDTLDLRVYTRPGSDWNFDGHGFQVGTIRYTYEPLVTSTYSWAGVVDHPVQVSVSNIDTGRDLYRDINYTVNWIEQTVTIVDGATDGAVINISVCELGGGSQLFRENYAGSDFTNDSVIIPVNAAEIYEIATFVNGLAVNDVVWEPYASAETWSILDSYTRNTIVVDDSTYYRALQNVPDGVDITETDYWYEFVPTLASVVTLPIAISDDDGISLVAYALTTIPAGLFVTGRSYTIATVGTTDFTEVGAASNTVGITFVATGPGTGTGTADTAYNWSAPQTEVFVADSGIVTNKVLTVTQSLAGTNPANLIVTRNGLRLQPPEGIEWIADDYPLDDSSINTAYGLPQRGGYEQSIINPITDITVWVDGILQTQSFGSFNGDYSVTNWDGSNVPGRQVVFAVPPTPGARILISVSTIAQYQIVNNTVEIFASINLGDRLGVTAWNDTAQQNILTLVFNGPVETGITIVEPYDSTDYDLAVISNTPGSYDYSVGTAIPTNDFNLQRTDVVAGRLLVTLDGERLFEGVDYSVSGDQLILSSGAIGPTQVLAVTQFTNSTVPEATAFRIFQDMRGVQATYRITAATSTVLAQAVTAADDVIYVVDADKLSEPNLENGVFGVVGINGERIMYRERNTSINTISGLLRGTAGTAAAAHSAGSEVSDFGRGNLLYEEYQDYTVSDTSTGDGSTAVFYAPSITVDSFDDSSTENLAVEVYVGGIRQYAYSDTTADSEYRWFITDWDPLAVDFVVDSETVPPLTAPAAGVEVTILVRRGVTWYAPGVGTASDGIALQDTNTVPARFLRGL